MVLDYDDYPDDLADRMIEGGNTRIVMVAVAMAIMAAGLLVFLLA